MGWVKTEQDALVATLRSTDPVAPTLCEGWDAKRLLAHLVLREQDPLGMVKDQRAHRSPGDEPNLTKLADAASSPSGFQELISRFAKGPSKLSPMSWASEKINFVEYLIHHEDIRRAGADPVEPRDLPAAEQRAVWKQLGLLARLQLRKAPTSVHLVTPAGEQVVVGSGPGVTISGEPVELALYAGGRRRQAKVEITGPADLVSRFEAWAATN